MGFFDFMTEEIAIDLGTANTLIIHLDKVVVDEPSIVARDIQTNLWTENFSMTTFVYNNPHATFEFNNTINGRMTTNRELIVIGFIFNFFKIIQESS